jgi:hypothetical protein
MKKRTKGDAKREAVDAAAKVMDAVVVEHQEIKWLDTYASGAPKKTMANAMQVIEALGLACSFDIFHNRYIVGGVALKQFHGVLSDKVTRAIRDLGRKRFGFDVGGEAMIDGVKRACEARMFHPVRDYLDRLKWDGVNRIDTWLTDYLGAEDTPLRRAQGRIVLLAGVKRIRDPGCKFDHILILEGPEGARKSSVVQVLASGKHGGNENFSDSPILGLDERKQQELTRGVWFYEVAELAGMRKADQYAVKRWVTSQADRARGAYEHFSEDQMRSFVAIGTFNTDKHGRVVEYLNPGDFRRWWSLLIGEIDIAALERDRDQLFAEADAALLMGDDCDLYLPRDREAEARAVAATREIKDTLADKLDHLFEDLTSDRPFMPNGRVPEPGRDYMLTPHKTEVWVSAGFVAEIVGGNHDGRRIAAAMGENEWAQVNDRRCGDKRRGYVHGWQH